MSLEIYLLYAEAQVRSDKPNGCNFSGAVVLLFLKHTPSLFDVSSCFLNGKKKFFDL